ncbi:MAG: hypothetical protein K8F26_10450 [Thiobacillus sp.]|jgi:hypothetical protein|nr:hypothetical protein [Thiobacillus sp.]
MTRWVFRVVCAAIFLFLGLIAGAFLMSEARPGIHAVVVEAKNTSKLTINKLVLTHEHGSVEIHNLMPNQIQTLAFFPGGENAYHLKVYFDDGRVVEGGGGYVEPGYAMRETISTSRIDTHYGL